MENKTIEFSSRKYWIEELKKTEESEKLIHDYSDAGYEKGFYYTSVDEECGIKLKEICKNNSFLMYSFLVSALKVNLSKYMFKKNITVGIPYYNSKNERKISYSKVLPLTSYIDYEITFKEYMMSVKQQISEIYRNQDFLNAEVLLENKTCTNVIELTPINICMKNLHEEKYIDYICNSSKNEVTFLFELTEKSLIKVDVIYNSKIFSETTVDKISKSFTKLLNDVLNNYNDKIKDIEILSQEEKNKIFHKFNNTKANYPKDKTIHELFEEQVEKTPNNIAVVFENEKLTYKELNEKSNQLARILRNKDVQADSIVGIMIESSLEMMIGIMGILKSGGAYLPIDTNYPKDRIEYMLKDAGVEILLTSKKLKDIIDFEGEIIDITVEEILTGEGSNLENVSKSDNLVYVIYTSGTTGNPKGVMIRHCNLVNYCFSIIEKAGITSEDETALLSSYAFDLGYTTVFTALISGITLNLLSEYEYKDTRRLIDHLKKGITYIKITPSLFNMLVNCKEVKRVFDNSKLRLIILGGETINIKDIEQFNFMNKEKKIKIMNHYGPTESTIGCIATMVNMERLDSVSNVIGRPLNNIKVYVLDRNKENLPIGVPGELYISGAGLANGYLNKPELTAEKFIDNPFETGTKIYKTGDLARWRHDGNIEFLGRLDNQVKILGFRIELGEIENSLLNFEKINQAVVIIRRNKNDENYICAYIVCSEDIDELEVKKYLKGKLPEYMIPKHFVKLERMPLTHNGKVDKRALPEPSITLSVYEAPRNLEEQKMVVMWCEILGVENIGINDNFFDLGGNSLKLTVFSNRMYQELEVEISLRELFELQTIKELSDYINTIEKSSYMDISKVDEAEYYKTSSAQKRMYMMQSLDAKSVSYNMPLAIELEGSSDKERIEKAIYALIKRHDALRTSFEIIDGQIVQKVSEDVCFEIEYDEYQSNTNIFEVVKDFVRPFDLGKSPLLRMKLVKLLENKYVIIFDMHHIISDGVSSRIFRSEFVKLYNGENLKPLKIQYKDFAQWQDKLFTSENFSIQKEYWTNVFQGEIPVLNINTDYKRTAIRNFQGDRFLFEADFELLSSLKKLAKETDTTMYMVLLSIYNILMYKYTGQEDIIIGSPIAGRRHADLQNVMGMFVNMIAIRSFPKGNKSFKELLDEVKKCTLKAYDNQDYQFDELVEDLNLNRDISRNPLFDIVFALNNLEDEIITLENIKFKNLNFEDRISKFDLTLDAFEKENRLIFSFEYATDLFKKETIERLAAYYLNILKYLIKNPSVKVSDIDIFSQDEKRKILFDFNNTSVDYEKDKTIHEVFMWQAEKTPEETAIFFEDKKITYKELNEKTNQLAQVLREYDVKRDEIIGIMTERSIDMIIGIFGILKSGGAYMPIDPDYPVERIQYMLKDSNSRILLTHNNLDNKIKYDGVIIDINEEHIFKKPVVNIENINEPDDLLYIMYTSGSTGNPKGVMLQHKGVVNLSKWFNDMFCLEKNKRIVHMANVSFDASIEEIFPFLTNGGSLYILRKEAALNKRKFINFVKENDINIAQFVPVTLKELLTDVEKPKSLNKIIVAGDYLEESLKNEILSYGYELSNHYGPTEGTVDSIVAKCEKDISTIGKPIYNTRAYILDKDGNLSPIGAPGELCIAGDGLARGYLNRNDLTEGKFVQLSFMESERIYKTGDLVSWDASGNIIFHGRIDNQIKLRGYRVELSEIELKLRSYPNITDVVVIDKIDSYGSKYLCAYIVGDVEISGLNLREYLSKSMPDYMIPSRFVKIDEIPTTHNGKIDRKALPEPDIKMNTGEEYAAPENEIEEKIAQLWKEALCVDNVGVNDNFFVIGGHSIKAVSLADKIHKELNVEISISEIFKYPTIRRIAEYIMQSGTNKYYLIPKAEEREYYPVSRSQKRLLILNELNKKDISYNMPTVLTIEGEIDVLRLENSFRKLIDRHEILRTTFKFLNGEPVQIIHDEFNFKIDIINSENEDIDKVISTLLKPFELDKLPLLRVNLVNYKSKKQLLIIDMHHIIADGISSDIFVNELINLYLGNDLRNMDIQYKDFSVWQNNYLNSQEIKGMEYYWENKIKDFTYTQLPVKFNSLYSESDGGKVIIRFNEVDTLKIENYCRKHSITKFTYFLAILNIIIMNEIDSNDIVIGVPVDGRDYEQLHNLIGLFLNVLVIRTIIDRESNFNEYIKSVSENLSEALKYKDYPYEELYEKVSEKLTVKNSLFSIMLNYMPYIENKEFNNLKIDNIVFKVYEKKETYSKYDLTFYIVEDKDSISLNATYKKSKLDDYVIERMVNAFINISNGILENEYVVIKDINYGNVVEDESFDNESEMLDEYFNQEEFF